MRYPFDDETPLTEEEKYLMSQEIEDKIVNHLVAKYFLVDVFSANAICPIFCIS